MTARSRPAHRGDDKLLFGIILGVLAFWLFAQTTLNIAPAMAGDLNVPTSVMNIAVSIIDHAHRPKGPRGRGRPPVTRARLPFARRGGKEKCQ